MKQNRCYRISVEIDVITCEVFDLIGNIALILGLLKVKVKDNTRKQIIKINDFYNSVF